MTAAIGDIKVKIEGAIVALEASAELSVNETLTFAGGLLSLNALATLLCQILGVRLPPPLLSYMNIRG